MKQYDVTEYVTETGKIPYREWVTGLKDAKARIKLAGRVDRASFGNFGDWKKIKAAPGLFEMREHYGPGYRIYYMIEENKLIILLAGSTKKDQTKMIEIAKQRLQKHKEGKRK